MLLSGTKDVGFRSAVKDLTFALIPVSMLQYLSFY